MLQNLKKMMVGRFVKLFRTALHDPEVRDDLRDIATELLRDSSVCNHMKSITSEIMRDLNVQHSIDNALLNAMADEIMQERCGKEHRFGLKLRTSVTLIFQTA